MDIMNPYFFERTKKLPLLVFFKVSRFWLVDKIRLQNQLELVSDQTNQSAVI
jgi:hypothetical protein